MPTPIDNPIFERIRTRIQEQVGTLLTDEELTTLVTAEVNAFFRELTPITFVRDSGMSYHNPRISIEAPITPFRALVWNAVQGKVEKAVTAYLSKGDTPVDAIIKELVEGSTLHEQHLSHTQRLAIAMAGAMFGNAMKAASRDAVFSLVNSVRNSTRLGLNSALDLENLLRYLDDAVPLAGTNTDNGEVTG